MKAAAVLCQALRLTLTIALLGVASRPAAAQQNCPQQRIEQENYLALSQQVYVYVPNIQRAGAGWMPFSARVLVGQYRPPLLLANGFMKEADLNKLLSNRRDVVQYPLAVPGGANLAAKTPPGAPAGFTLGGASITIRVLGVEQASGSTLRVLLEACGLKK